MVVSRETKKSHPVERLMHIKSVEAESPHVSMMWRFQEGVVKVSDHGRHVMSSSPVTLKTNDVGERCTLNLSKAQASSLWCGVVVRRGGASSGVILVI
ncbi:hypothetical protein TNCV_2484321 [Trichonephila clavipes]|uniref:Uncharacterized protein n=1 Tax=Trichonephila clavipes TaxID=2585209 RepID=A0A8X6VZ86_TRICX|nr:hypothetical protein TNCV_2484321 [Trichonephila clavipes]